MTISIGAYVLCDGTLENGVAVSELRLNQRRIYDVFDVLPDSYRIGINSAGTGYEIDDDLFIDNGDGQFAAILVTAVGDSGEVTGFRTASNTFHSAQTLSASGGMGSGAFFSAGASIQPNVTSPLAYDRTGRPCTYAFTVKRTHADVGEAEDFIIGLEDALPVSGTVAITTSGPVEYSFEIPNGRFQSHDLQQQIGATTFHSYSIIGGAPVLIP